MPRLINPGLGDLIDRASILELKIEHGQTRSVAVRHFEAELNEVEHVIMRFPEDVRELGRVKVSAERLDAINRELWALTDQLRAHGQRLQLTDADVRIVAGLGLLILRRNDERAACVATIDKAAGTYVGQEKL